MTPGLLVKLRPITAWRTGSDSGAKDRVEPIYHSDGLYSAVTGAMASLGLLGEWLAVTATAAGQPAVAFSSCFPFQGDLRFIVPPRMVWPLPPSARVRWKGARFVPVSLLQTLLRGKAPDEDRWAVDGPSECLVPVGTQGPFRPSVRSRAAVDRLTGCSTPHATACLEFTPGAGWWTVAAFSGKEAKDRWLGPVEAAFRLLADSGFGGGKSLGWGRTEAPEFSEGSLPDMILSLDWTRFAHAENGSEIPAQPEKAYWLLSLYAPDASDSIDWQRGVYSLLPRAGHVDSPAGAGFKKSVQMVEEGSVLLSSAPPRGSAPDVAPVGFPHPVYRAGFAVPIPIPWQAAYMGPPSRATRVPPKPEPTTETAKPVQSPPVEAPIAGAPIAEGPVPETPPPPPEAEVSTESVLPSIEEEPAAVAEPEPEAIVEQPVSPQAAEPVPEPEPLPAEPSVPEGEAPESEKPEGQ